MIVAQVVFLHVLFRLKNLGKGNTIRKYLISEKIKKKPFTSFFTLFFLQPSCCIIDISPKVSFASAALHVALNPRKYLKVERSFFILQGLWFIVGLIID
jgi:hypothetical protein